MILGIDPGKHHIGMCLYDPDTERIVSWGVHDVDDSTPHRFVETFRKRLEAVVGDETPTGIAIERQPPKNQSMTRISHWMQLYLAMTYPDARLVMVPPTRRLKYIRLTRPDLPVDTYPRRKRSSVIAVTAWLQEHDSSWTGWFHDQSKKDDCAESFLLCLVDR